MTEQRESGAVEALVLRRRWMNDDHETALIVSL